MVASMKVLHIVKTAVGANWAYEQVRVLCSLGIEVVVALPSDTEGLAPKYREAGAAVVRANLDFPAREPWRMPARLRACRQLVADVRPDLIHTHHVGPTFVARLALGKNSPIPRVFQVPGPLHLEHSFFARLDIALAGRRDFWIATCESTQEKYRLHGVAPDRVFLSRIGMRAIRIGPRKNDELRRKLRIPLEAPVVGMVAHIYAPKLFLGQTRGVKGHEDFIAALALIKKARPDVRGVIVGSSWQKSGVWYEKRLHSQGDRICGTSLIFLGHRTDLDQVSGLFDVAVQPSHSEAVAWSVAELLQRNIPVVATNVGGLPDLIQENRTGWLVPPRNPEALARAVLEALGNPEEAQRRAARGRELARHLLDVDKTGCEIAAIYEKLLGAAEPTILSHHVELARQTAAAQSEATVMRSHHPSSEV
jgi:glycosyltransferase involved in cell wall biosynthesis